MRKPNLAEPFNAIYDLLSLQNQEQMVDEILLVKDVPKGLAIVPAIQQITIQNMRLDEIEKKYHKLIV